MCNKYPYPPMEAGIFYAPTSYLQATSTCNTSLQPLLKTLIQLDRTYHLKLARLSLCQRHRQTINFNYGDYKMKHPKKTILAALLVSTLAFGGLHSAIAKPGAGAKGQGPMHAQLDKATIEARNKFLNDTTELRKQLTVKHVEMRSLMHNDTVDPKATAAVSGELFDIKEQLRKKATESGLTNYAGMGPHGSGMGFGSQMRGGRGFCNR